MRAVESPKTPHIIPYGVGDTRETPAVHYEELLAWPSWREGEGDDGMAKTRHVQSLDLIGRLNLTGRKQCKLTKRAVDVEAGRLIVEVVWDEVVDKVVKVLDFAVVLLVLVVRSEEGVYGPRVVIGVRNWHLRSSIDLEGDCSQLPAESWWDSIQVRLSDLVNESWTGYPFFELGLCNPVICFNIATWQRVGLLNPRATVCWSSGSSNASIWWGYEILSSWDGKFNCCEDRNSELHGWLIFVRRRRRRKTLRAVSTWIF